MDRMLIRVFAEGVGTFFLCCGVGLAFFVGGDLAPFMVAGTLFAAMGITGFVSGAMFNPAVTTGVILYKSMRGSMTLVLLKELLLTYVIQFVFGLLGALMAWGITNNTYRFTVVEEFATSQAFFGELLWTSLLVGSAIMIGQTTESNLVAGMAVIATVFTGATSIGKVSNAALNPAVGICVSLVDAMATGERYTDWPIYFFAPLLGSVLGTFIAHLIILEIEAKKIEEERNKNTDDLENLI